MAFEDYSTNPGLNTIIGDDTFIGPNMPRDNVRPALQQLAADGRGLYDTVNTLASSGMNTDPLLRADLASTANGKGSALVSFKQSGVGAISRTVLAELLSRPITPEQYGAVGDATYDHGTGEYDGTDDTAAVMAAVAAALSTKRDLYFPSLYLITDTIEIGLTLEDFLSLNIRGCGNNSGFVWDGGNNKPMIHVFGYGAGAAGWYSKCSFENFRLVGNSYTAGIHTGAYSGVTGIQLGDTPENGFSGVINPNFVGLTIQHVAKGIHGLYESDQVTIFGCYIEHFTEYGIYNQHGGSNWSILSNHISDGHPDSTAIRSSLASTRVIANTIQGAEFAVGVQIDGGTTNQGQSPYIVGNYIECQLDHTYAIALYGVWGGKIDGNILKGCRGSTLILIDELSGYESRNIEIGTNIHTVSGGSLSRFAYCHATAVGCFVSGQLESRATDGTPGVYTTAKLEGPFASVLDVGTLDLSGALKIDGVQTLSNRKTGWAVATGTATRTTFATGSVTLPQLAERVKALIDDLHGAAGHGLIGT